VVVPATLDDGGNGGYGSFAERERLDRRWIAASAQQLMIPDLLLGVALAQDTKRRRRSWWLFPCRFERGCVSIQNGACERGGPGPFLLFRQAGPLAELVA